MRIIVAENSRFLQIGSSAEGYAVPKFLKRECVKRWVKRLIFRMKQKVTNFLKFQEIAFCLKLTI